MADSITVPLSDPEAKTKAAEEADAKALATFGESGHADDVPDKFKNEDGTTNVEKLAAAYRELEKQKSQVKTAEDDAEDESERSEDDEEEETEEDLDEDKEARENFRGALSEEETQIADFLEEKGVDLFSIQQEYDTNEGQLSQETYKNLDEAGFPKALVDDYMRGKEVQAQQSYEALVAEGGGQEQLEQMLAWSAEGMSDAERRAYNKAVSKGSLEEAKLAVRGLRQKYEAANGRKAKRVKGSSPAKPATVEGFSSWDEVTRAMGDPRYKTDPAYRSSVAKKLEASKLS